MEYRSLHCSLWVQEPLGSIFTECMMIWCDLCKRSEAKYHSMHVSERVTIYWSILNGARFTYTEDNNAITTVTGSASQMGGSESFWDKRLFITYRPMGLSRNSACLKIINGQKQSELSEYSMCSWPNGGNMEKIRILTRVCLVWPNKRLPKETEELGENQHRQGQWGHWRFIVKKLTETAL